MRKFAEYSKYNIFTLFVVGLGLLLYGGYQYYTSSQDISEIEDLRAETQELLEDVSPGEVNPSAIAGTDIQRRRQLNDLHRERDNAIRLIGIGIALIAAAWIVRDFVVARFAKATVAVENNEPPSA